MSNPLSSHYSPSFSSQGISYKQAYDKFLGNTTQCTRIANLFSQIVLLVVLILGVLSSAQVFPGTLMGWCTVGTGASYLTLKLFGTNWQDRKIDLISSSVIALSIALVGALSIYEVISGSQMGYALIGEVILITGISVTAMICTKRCEPIVPRAPKSEKHSYKHLKPKKLNAV